MLHPASPGPWPAEMRRFIEAGGNTTHAFGMGRLVGRMYALLYLSPEPLPLERIAELLGISKASASIAARRLAAWGAIRLLEFPNDRRDLYEAETNFRRVLVEGLLPGLRKKLRSAGRQIDRALTAGVNPGPAQDHRASVTEPVHDEIRRRLRAAKRLHKRVDGLLSSRLLQSLL